MSGMISVFLQSGETGVWLALPAGKDDFLKAVSEIGAAGSDDITIGKYKTDVAMLTEELLLSANLDVVNYLAARLSSLSPDDIELLEAILESPLRSEVLPGIAQVIDFADNTGAYEIYQGVRSPEDLARYYIEESGFIQMPPEWAEGIELERFGKNLEKHEPGYYTKHGYLIATGLAWTPVFEKSGEVPSAYRILFLTVE